LINTLTIDGGIFRVPWDHHLTHISL